MRNVSFKHVGTTILGTAASMVAFALPASALGVSLGGSNVIHIDDCRSVSLARQAAYDFAFSSNSTGPQTVHVADVVDGALTLCYSLDVKAVTDFSIVTQADVTVAGVVSGLVSQTDASKVCTEIRLKVGPGVRGTVSASTRLHVSADGAPPADWIHQFAEDVVVDSIGEDIVLKGCADTSGNVSAA